MIGKALCRESVGVELTSEGGIYLSQVEAGHGRSTAGGAAYRAYLLKEQLRQIYRLPADAAVGLLERWLKWARRGRRGARGLR